MTKKRLMAMLLALVMIVSVFVGCGKQNTDTPSKQTDPKETNGGTANEPVQSEPTVITIASTYANQSTPIPWYETEVWKKIQEEANVIINYIEYDADQFNLMLASGEVPDLVLSTVMDKVDDIVKSKLALDLAPLIEQYAPNMAGETYVQRNQLVAANKGGDGNALYFIAPHIGLENAGGGVDSGRGYALRWDYYLEMGKPTIGSDADYVEILDQMQAAHPTTENGEKVYAMGLWDRFDYWYFRAAFVKPVLANPWTVSNSQYMASLVDGKMINGYTETERSAYWVDMEFYNELYKRGLLDPDSFTQTKDEYTTKVKAGRYLATAPTRDMGLYNEAKKTDPETLTGIVRIVSENAAMFGNKKMLTGDFPNWYVFVSAKTENAEAVMRFLNVLHDLDTQRMLWSGFEGVHWNYVDGVPTFTDEMIEMIKTGDEELKRLGIRIEVKHLETVQKSFLHTDGYPVDLNETDTMRATTMTPIQESMAETWDVAYPSKAYVELVEAGKTVDMSQDSAQLIATYMPSQPTDVARIIEKCNDILYRAIPKLVMAKDDAEFAAIQAEVLKELADAGEQEAWKWISEEYAKAYDLVRPIFDTTQW